MQQHTPTSPATKIKKDMNSSLMALSLLNKKSTLRPSEQRIVEKYEYRKQAQKMQ